MRIATHNVNSIRTRVGRVVDWLERSKTDVLAMQEIKCKPEQFPVAAFEAAGYQVIMHGLDQWNGVAFATKIPAEDIEIGFSGMPSFGKEGKPETVITKISQETLAEMIGTTRSRVSFFMNKFRKMGFIEYNGELHVHSSLLNVVLHD